MLKNQSHTIVLSVKFNADELKFIRKIAKQNGKTISYIVRRGAMREAIGMDNK